MKKNLKLWLILLITLTLIISVFTSCDLNQDEEPDDVPLDGLVLVRNNVAQFKVVIASGAGSEGRRAAGELVDTLRALGVEIEDAIEDRKADAVTDCEIIVGVGAKNRPDGCAILASDLGNEGYVIRAVGSRIVIAGGTATLTRSTVKMFIEDCLGITADTETLENKAVDEDLEIYVPTEYSLDSITIAGSAVSDYVIVCDENDTNVYPMAVMEVKNTIYGALGVNLEICDVKNVTANKKQIRLATVADAGEGGFRVYISGSDMVIECALGAMFYDVVSEFVKDNISSKTGNVAFEQSFTYSKSILTVKYADFGAVGDGKTDDFFAIKRAHEAVNVTGQKLIAEGTGGKTFYIGKTWIDGKTVNGVVDCDRSGKAYAGQSISIKTDMDFADATFIIDDTIEGIHPNSRRAKHIFCVDAEIEVITLSESTTNSISNFTDDLTLKAGQKSIPWLKEVLKNLPGSKFVIELENKNKRDFIRFGTHQNEGYVRSDAILVDKEGNVDEKTPLAFDFATITVMRIQPTDDKPVTISGGKFITKCAKTTDDEFYQTNKSTTFARGLKVFRPNTVVTNIDHKVEGEPDTMGYSYSSFISIADTHNVTLKDSKLSGRRHYTVGTYDLAIADSTYIVVKNITQYRDIKDSKYWGINVTNGCKNLTYDNVTISRVDAHCGFWNVSILNSTIGFDINVIGGGNLHIENVTKRVGDRFMKLRKDYGATFDGIITIKNCHLNGYKTWNSKNGDFNKEYNKTLFLIEAEFNVDETYDHPEYGKSSYATWDFGYTCYMPREIHLDNFTYDKVDGRSFYVYNSVEDEAFNKNLPNGGYQLTELITYKNMEKPLLCKKESSTKVRGIRIEKD